jgi:hypothetical protein
MNAIHKHLEVLLAASAVVVGLLGGWCLYKEYQESRIFSQNIQLRNDISKLMRERDTIKEEFESFKERISFVETYDEGFLNIEYVTRGVRNRNPMNIVAMSSKNPWRGQIGKDNENHAIFETFEHGLRAGYLTLRKYYEKHGINTLLGITTRFCEGDAKAYANFIAQNIGVEPDEPINVLDYMPEIMKSMVRYENGFDIFPDTYFVPYYNH